MPDAGSRFRAVFGLRGWCMVIILCLIAGGCATSSTPQAPGDRSGIDVNPDLSRALRAEIGSWLGAPHQLGGMSRQGVDCSGLVVAVYGKLFDRRLPRTTDALIRTGQHVDKRNLMGGDLVFFKPGYKSRHVGIYLGRGEFAHASTSGGVMISRMDDQFWQRCYVSGRRVL